MSTLLLRLAGPMQAWGTQSRFSIRDTGLEPSKSGVIGLLCAALGKPRDEKLNDAWPTLEQLAALRMGVRVDGEGSMKADYHTTGGTHRRGEVYGIYRASGDISRDPVVSTRYYLADADFLVGLEGNPDLLARLNEALAEPKWQLYLGRKSFVPAVPPRLPDRPPFGPGLRDEPLLDALTNYPYFHDGRAGNDLPERLRLVVDAPDSPGGEVRRDVPLSFSVRRFGVRYVETRWIDKTAEVLRDVSFATDSERA
jgi:CRISPR system Cascade subunit CasD